MTAAEPAPAEPLSPPAVAPEPDVRRPIALIVGVAAPAQADARVDQSSSAVSATQTGSSELIAPAGALFASLLIWGAGAAFATRRRMLAEQREEASLIAN